MSVPPLMQAGEEQMRAAGEDPTKEQVKQAEELASKEEGPKQPKQASLHLQQAVQLVQCSAVAQW